VVPRLLCLAAGKGAPVCLRFWMIPMRCSTTNYDTTLRAIESVRYCDYRSEYFSM